MADESDLLSITDFLSDYCDEQAINIVEN